MKPERTAREALIDSLQVGDLVKLNGTLRVVRDIGRCPTRSKWTRLHPERVYSVTFAILRCSWTRKAYTTRNRTDLYAGSLEVVKRGFGVEHGPLEVMLQRDIAGKHGKALLECCDVIGVVT